MLLGMLGGVFGQAPLRVMVAALDWRSATLVIAIGGVLIAVVAGLSVRDRHRGTGGVGAVLLGMLTVMRNRQTWLIAIAGLGTTGPLLGFAGLWGVPYLATIHGLDRTAAASITSMLFIGWGLGAPVVGWLSDRMGRRKPAFTAGLTVCTAAIATLVFVPALPVSTIAALCFLCGLGGAGQIVGFAAVREHNPDRLSGSALGFVNGMVTGAGALYQPLLGWLLDLGWKGEMSAGARVYDAAAYRTAFSVLVAGAFVGFLCTLAMRETHCRQLGASR
jgi:MFS family permease